MLIKFQNGNSQWPWAGNGNARKNSPKMSHIWHYGYVHGGYTHAIHFQAKVTTLCGMPLGPIPLVFSQINRVEMS